MKYIILHKSRPFRNKYFDSLEEAANYIVMQYPNKKFKKFGHNIFCCTRYGTLFEIIELKHKNDESA